MGTAEPRTLYGRVAIITGASRGFSRDIAVRFAADGAMAALLAAGKESV